MKEVDVVVGTENAWLKSLHGKNRFGHVLRGSSDSDVLDEVDELVRKHDTDVLFKIKGGLLGFCVRRVAEHAVNTGAKAEINLLYCAIETKDDVRNAPFELLQKRLGELRWRMEPKYLNHPRLAVVQYSEKIWD